MCRYKMNVNLKSVNSRSLYFMICRTIVVILLIAIPSEIVSSHQFSFQNHLVIDLIQEYLQSSSSSTSSHYHSSSSTSSHYPSSSSTHSHYHSTMLSQTPAADRLSTAYLFPDIPHRSIRVTSQVLHDVTADESLLEAESFTLMTAFRHRSRTVGTILALGTQHQSYLELELNGIRNELRLHYLYKSRSRTEIFSTESLLISDDRWHKLSVGVADRNHVTVYIDCQLIGERRVEGLAGSKAALSDQMFVWLGQRNDKHGYFKGAIEYIRIVNASDGHLHQCPRANTPCPTCSEFQELKKMIATLQEEVTRLNKKLEKSEERLQELEQCECRRGCVIDGRSYRNDEVIPTQDQCMQCVCRGGKKECHKPVCPPVECSNSYTPPGECCPICPKRCWYYGKRYEDGERFVKGPCISCVCQSGKLNCTKQKKSECPRLPCPKHERITVEGACCKICSGTKFCGQGSSVICPMNSTCTDLVTRHACVCHEGFYMDNNQCLDKNECNTVGGSGSYCHLNTLCVNEVGGYRCECLEGYTRRDEYNCRDIDECRHRNLCGEHSQCINTPGSYQCICAEGYTGDGKSCTPQCEVECSHGGQCVAPGVCSCPSGFMGPSCQNDIDECALGLAHCHVTSQCVNVIGSYYCECRAGYYSNQTDTRLGTLCNDVNECNGWGEGNQCHPDSTCVNTYGGHKCHCEDRNICGAGCWLDSVYHEDGATWHLHTDSCTTCRCQNGVTTCEKPECNCNDVTSWSKHGGTCCSDVCSTSSMTSCKHQQLSVTYKHGDTWQLECQQCQCIAGEVDCRPLECPALDCPVTQLRDGDCCPSCAREDLCLVPQHHQTSRPCLVAGYRLNSGQRIDKLSGECSTCTCMDGHICCTYTQSCRSRSEHLHTHLNHRTRLGPIIGSPDHNNGNINNDISQHNYETEESSNGGGYRVEVNNWSEHLNSYEEGHSSHNEQTLNTDNNIHLRGRREVLRLREGRSQELNNKTFQSFLHSLYSNTSLQTSLSKPSSIESSSSATTSTTLSSSSSSSSSSSLQEKDSSNLNHDQSLNYIIDTQRLASYERSKILSRFRRRHSRYAERRAGN